MLSLRTNKNFHDIVKKSGTESLTEVNGISRSKADERLKALTTAVYLGEIAMLNVQTKNLGSVAILSVEGQVVIGQTEILRDAIESLSPTNSVILDLSCVAIIDAHGLGVMLQLRQQLLDEGISFELINVSKNLSRIFEITRLNSVFQINSGVQIFPRSVHTHRVAA